MLASRLVTALSGAYAVLAAPGALPQQQPMRNATNKADFESSTIRLPGHNHVKYGPTPKAHQIFDVQFLDIYPSTIPVDDYFFGLLRGNIPKEHNHLDLTKATLTLTNIPERHPDRRTTTTIPLKTAAYTIASHISIRGPRGQFTDYFTTDDGSQNDILFDNIIFSFFFEDGTYTIEATAMVDEICLFSYTLTQWFERPH
ncbi:Hypothetical protein D9617_1g088580 [Elsinoe fawcettii]|nr:Hypothetical protein D9617_1g088580 [Elsinoe fawcettii]